MKRRGRCRGPRVAVGSESLLSSAGGGLLLQTAELVGLPGDLSQALAPWRPRRARHDPGKVLLDLAVAVALGGDCLADLAAVRCQPELFGEVASDPTVCPREPPSRLSVLPGSPSGPGVADRR